MFELIQLEQLVAIAHFGTVSKAAEQLHISQPALSRSIRNLEDKLGVSLFEHQKNRVALNESGKLAVEYAQRLLDEAAFMTERLRAFSQSQRVLSLGSVSPTPIWYLTSVLSDLFIDVPLRSEIKTADELLKGIHSQYQIIITNNPAEDPLLQSFPYLKEELFVAVSPTHKLASCKKISLCELNGQSILRLVRTSFWDTIYKEKMPDSLFPVIETLPAFSEVVKTSTLPYFVTNLIGRDIEDADKRIYIPVTDPEAHVTFYCHIKKTDSKRFARLTSAIENLCGS